MIDLLTVVYRDELYLLEQQAKSFLYNIIDHDSIKNIYVILNDPELTHEDINLDWYGVRDIRDKVRIIHRNEFGYYPPTEMRGWYTQQVCKILGTINAECEWCFIFDAKTLLVTPFNLELILSHYNRGKFADWSKHISPHWQTGLQFLKEKYNLEKFHWISPVGVPFLAHVPTMRAMVYEEPDFVEWFHTYCDFPNMFNRETKGITEFLCYSVYVSSIPNLFEKLYTGTQHISVYNLADYEVDKFDEWFSKLKADGRAFTASIHPRAYALLTDEQKYKWNNWIKLV